MESIRIVLLTELNISIKLTSIELVSQIKLIDPFNQPDLFTFNEACDLFILDTEKDQSCIIKLIEVLTRRFTSSKIIVVSSAIDRELAHTILGLGVTGLLLRHEISNDCSQYLFAVHRGRIVISPRILKNLLHT